jgi:hypothetical protein
VAEQGRSAHLKQPALAMHGFRIGALAAGLALASVAPMPSHAALGGDVVSVLRDHELLHASHTVTPTVNYDLHEGVSTDGVQLREYVDRSGKVFAVGWQGPRSPDVGRLLGTYAARYYDTARLHHGGHHVLAVNQGDLVVTVVRLPRGWQGRAYLPAAIPAGVDPATLH